MLCLEQLESRDLMSAVPVLTSNPDAQKKLFLDFDGDFQSTWGSWANIATPEYNVDGTAGFSDQELANIYEIWSRVTEDFYLFDVDVTTVDPGSLSNSVVAKVNIGGSSWDWYGSSAGGVAYVGGFYNASPNVAYVFPGNLGSPKSVAEASSHEAGHLFGLKHQSVCNGTTLVTQYNQGGNGWAPLMGTGYYQPRTTWHNGTTTTCVIQEDIERINLTSLPLRPDDVTTLAMDGPFTFAGFIGHFDSDRFTFDTTGGAASFSLATAPIGPNLLANLQLTDSTGNLLASGASINADLPAGSYFVDVVTDGSYGNNGQYTLTGSFNVEPPPPPPDPPPPQVFGFYVWDIAFTRKSNKVQASAVIKWDSNFNGVADASDENLVGASVALVISGFRNRTITRTTDASGRITSGLLPKGSYSAEVTAVVFTDYSWLHSLDPTVNDNDINGNGLPDDQFVAAAPRQRFGR